MVLMNVIGVENTRCGVEIGVGVKNVYLSKPMDKGLRALHSHGLQIPNNENNQSLVTLDFKPFTGLFLIKFFIAFHCFSLSKTPFMVWVLVWKNWCGKSANYVL